MLLISNDGALVNNQDKDKIIQYNYHTNIYHFRRYSR